MIQEGDVVEKLQTQVQTGKPIYDAYINDDDFIGFHARYPYTRNLTDWMAGEGKVVTDPYFDLNDFLGLADATGLKSRGFDGKPLAAARPVLHQRLLVPQGLVRPARPEGGVQEEVRL